MDPFLNPYLQQLLKDKDSFLENLRKIADRDNVHIVREDTASLLRCLVQTHKPATILEAGTAIGFSSILMSKAYHQVCPESYPQIDTIEIDPDIAATARRNIEEAGLSNIHVILGDAAEVFSCLSGKYDMIFVDSAKSQYIQMYDDIKRMLKPGGLLVCDNVIFYGKIYDAPEEAPRKHRAIITNLRAFLERLMEDDDFTSTILVIGDGVTLSFLKN